MAKLLQAHHYHLHHLLISKVNQMMDGNISSLQSFKDVISGKSGYNIEDINNQDMLIVYAPVKFKSTTWGVLFSLLYQITIITNHSLNWKI